MTSHAADDSHPAPQAEHDKLGPLGQAGGPLAGAALRTAMLGEFVAAADAAREAAAHAGSDANTAVHDYRKALRRARAVLTLVSGALPKSERRAVKRSLQEARRAVSTIRDHAVAPDAIAHLDLGDDERAAATSVLANASEAMPPPGEVQAILTEGAKRAAQQAEALEAALPRELELDTIIDGFREIYAEARDDRDEAKHDTKAFHAWRRRTKELVYQLELLAKWGGKRVQALHEAMKDSADELSKAVDLIMLREFVATYAQGVGNGHVAKLADVLDAELATRMRAARKASRDAFDRRPKKLAGKLAKALAHQGEQAEHGEDAEDAEHAGHESHGDDDADDDDADDDADAHAADGS